MSPQVLHLDFVSLTETTGTEDRAALLEAVSRLGAMPQVESIGVIEAGSPAEPAFDLVFYFLLPDFAALEPFGTDPAYAAFLQGAVAPRLKAFAGADVRLEAGFVAAAGSGACLALIAPEETYDWEVRDALQAWCDACGAASSIVGLAVGERQMYRGAALVFGDSLQPAALPEGAGFRTTLIAGTARKLS